MQCTSALLQSHSTEVPHINIGSHCLSCLLHSTPKLIYWYQPINPIAVLCSVLHHDSMITCLAMWHQCVQLISVYIVIASQLSKKTSYAWVFVFVRYKLMCVISLDAFVNREVQCIAVYHIKCMLLLFTKKLYCLLQPLHSRIL